MTISFFFNLKKEEKKGGFKMINTYYRVFNYINVPMEVKKKNKQTMFLYLFSTIAVLKHMSLKENKVQFRKKCVCACCHQCGLSSRCDGSNAN